ncbi:hypothetical protein ABIC08_007081 [Bradyrhizobium sp. RT9b]|uniref:hypothetical protein n=1 Tax=Bradyrhizobium sp. RT9b TaxID=3156385 RepID=UPI003390AC72
MSRKHRADPLDTLELLNVSVHRESLRAFDLSPMLQIRWLMLTSPKGKREPNRCVLNDPCRKPISINHLEKHAGCSRSVTDRKRCDGNKRPWKLNAGLKRYVETSAGRKSAGRFLSSITGKCSILFVTAIGCLLRSFPITPEQRSLFYETDGWSDAQPAKVSNIV